MRAEIADRPPPTRDCGMARQLWIHVDQYAQGKVTNNLVTNQLEDEAYAADEKFWNDFLSGKAGH